MNMKQTSYLLWGDNTKVVWTEKPALILPEKGVFDRDHILLWDDLHDFRDSLGSTRGGL